MDANTQNRDVNAPVVTKQPLPEGAVVVHQTIIRPIDRQSKDIGYYRTAHIAAERPNYPNRVRLYDLYEDIRLDGHLVGVVKKRSAAVLNKKLHYYDPAGAIVKPFNKLIKLSSFRKMIKELMLQKAWGVSGFEFIPGAKFAWKKINRKHIKPELGIIAVEQYGIEGYDYNVLPLVWVVGDADEYGYFLECAPYALYKRGTMGDWSQFSEIFGMPIRVIKYDSNDLKTKIELKEVLDESGSAVAIMIPKQCDFDIKDGKMSNADGAIYQNLKKACDDEMSVVVLGVTETTTSSDSSGYAQADVHASQQLEITKEDLTDIEGLLNDDKFIAILKSYGFPVVEGGEFRYEEEVNLQSLKTRISIDMQVSTKVPISDDHWYKTYGIEKPANYKKLKSQQQENTLPEDFEDDEEEEETDDENKPENSKPTNTSRPNKFRMKFWDRFMARVANFFDRARVD